MLLRNLSRIPPANAEPAVAELIQRYRNRATAKQPAAKVLDAEEVNVVLDAFRAERSSWMSASSWLRCYEQESARREPDEALDWKAFEDGQYVQRPQFGEAVRALDDNGFALIHGYPGFGKTTLARFLTHHYLSRNAHVNGNVLSVRTHFKLRGEKHFFESNLTSPTLFVIEDAHFAEDAVRDLLRAYLDARLSGRGKAKVIVTSQETSTRKMLGQREMQGEPLTYAVPIRLEQLTDIELKKFLDDWRANCGVQLPLESAVIAKLAGGRIGIAMIVMRVARDLAGHISVHKLLEDKLLIDMLRQWVLEKTALTDTPQIFEEHLVPVFNIMSYGICRDDTFGAGVRILRDAGLVAPHDAEGAGPQIADFALSFLLNAHYHSRISTSFKQLIEHDRTFLAPAFRRLANDRSFGHQALKELLEAYFDSIVEALTDSSVVLPLSDVAGVLISTFRVSRPDARRLFRQLAAPRGESSLDLLDTMCQLERIHTPSMVSAFFTAMLTIDGQLTRRLARDVNQLGIPQAEVLTAVFNAPESSLQDVAAALRSLYRCSRDFARFVSERLNDLPSFRRKLADAERDPSPLDLAAYCSIVYSFNRPQIGAIIDRSFTVERLESLFVNSGDQTATLVVLQQLRGVRSRTVADALTRIWQNHADLLITACESQEAFVDFTKPIYFVGRLNRRVARQLAAATQHRARQLISELSDYHDAGSELAMLERIVGWPYANDVAQHLDRDAVLASIKQETHRFTHIGLSLRNFYRMDAEVGFWFEERLEFEDVARKVSANHLFNLTYLLHGFVHATPVTLWPQRIAEYLQSNSIRREFKRAWNRDRSLTQATLCMHLLTDASLSTDDIRRLIGYPTWGMMERNIRERFSAEPSLLNFAAGLYQFALLCPEMAEAALIVHVETSGYEPQTVTEDATGRIRQRHHEQNVPTGARSYDLVEVGAMLRIAAMVNPEQAKILATRLNLDRFVAAAQEEMNLGRLAAFVSGLNEASHAVCLEFLERVSRLNLWELQLEENENLRNVLHYGRILALVSSRRSTEYVDFVVQRVDREIVEFAEAEANLMEISNWLRALSGRNSALHSKNTAELIPALHEASEYDLSLRHLLEATEALAECDSMQEARRFAELASSQSAQVRQIYHLHNFVEILQKALWVEHRLQLPGFAERLFA